jgi:TonB family protein
MFLFSMLLLVTVPGFGQEPGGAQGAIPPGAVMDYDQAPRPVKMTRPDYPDAAFEKGIEGTVTLEILIDREGRVSKARVLQSVPSLDDAAMKCVMRWRFKPAMKRGLPVETLAHAPITFRVSAKPQGRK